MLSKNKNQAVIDLEQHELLETAQRRVKQKKRLFAHLVIFLIGSVFLVLINKVLKFGATYDWFIWAITFWAFLFILHAFNILITQRFMGKAWERSQREKLVAKQRARIAEMQKEIDTDFPLSRINKKE
ncbi:MAG: 2TM domain-containing protein [Maribacter sp.]|uniref:2TM domain-containing protein n=1 Tax=Maribacter sp. TaxID=1897614 RepID=UPI003297EEE1